MAGDPPAELPGSFGDLSGPAFSVLDDDFHCSGFQLEAKKETGWNQTSTEFTVNLGPPKTSTNFSFSFPKPLTLLGTQVPGLAGPKLEFDEDGKCGVELSFEEELHKVPGLTLGLVTDLNECTFSSTYNHTGMDAMLKFETTNSSPKDFTLEGLKRHGSFMVGTKLDMSKGGMCPSVGVSTESGKFFASLTAENQFTEFVGHGLYNVSDDIQVAASYAHGGDDSGSWALGAAAAVNKELSVKAKFESASLSLIGGLTHSFSMAFKKDLAKGTALLGGFTYSVDKGDMGYGAKVCIE